VREYGACLAIEPGDPRCLTAHALAKIHLGDRREAEDLIARWSARDPGQRLPYFQPRMMLQAGLGREADAIETLRASIEYGDPGLAFVWIEPAFDGLRKNAAFRELAKAVPQPNGAAVAARAPQGK
jgi:hypothetical protein